MLRLRWKIQPNFYKIESLQQVQITRDSSPGRGCRQNLCKKCADTRWKRNFRGLILLNNTFNLLNFQHISYIFSALSSTLGGQLCNILSAEKKFSRWQRIPYINFSKFSAYLTHFQGCSWIIWKINFEFFLLLYIQKQHRSKTKQHCIRAVQLKNC